MSSNKDHAREPSAAKGEISTGTLAGLIERLAEGAERRDEGFARRLAAALHAKAVHLTFPEVEAMGLDEVMVTFYMDREMRLVVTGAIGQSGGQGSVRWRECDFPRIPIVLHRAPRSAPYLFATLDFSHRGERATLTSDVSPFEAGEPVVVRCLATVGDEVTYRVVARDRELSVAPEALSPFTP